MSNEGQTNLDRITIDNEPMELAGGVVEKPIELVMKSGNRFLAYHPTPISAVFLRSGIPSADGGFIPHTVQAQLVVTYELGRDDSDMFAMIQRSEVPET